MFCSRMRAIASLGGFGGVSFGSESRKRTQSSEPSGAMRALISGFVKVTLCAVHTSSVRLAQWP